MFISVSLFAAQDQERLKCIVYIKTSISKNAKAYIWLYGHHFITGASSTSARGTGAESNVLLAPVLEEHCFQHRCYSSTSNESLAPVQCQKYIDCYLYSLQCSQWHEHSDRSQHYQQNGIVFCVYRPKISTRKKKLASTGRHGWHIFATLDADGEIRLLSLYSF